LDPEGTTDPAGSTDCGEACLESAVLARRGLRVAAGCIRQGLELPPTNGSTTGEQLALVWKAFGGEATVRRGESAQASPHGLTLRQDGRYRLLLGEWIEPGMEHWVLAYHTEGEETWVMDPWTASHIALHMDVISREGAGVWVDLT